MSKLKLKDTAMDIVIKMSEGNPGAITVIIEILKDGYKNMHQLLFLDTLEIYGSRLYQLWNDCCQKDKNKMLTVINNVMCGKMTSEELYKKIDQPYGENIEVTK